MSLSAIREQIKVILSGVPDIGVIHDYERFNNDWNQFLAIFQDASGRINGCMFYRTQRRTRNGVGGPVEKAHVFTFRRFMALQDADATGIAFDETNELIAEAFNNERPETDTLNNTCLTIKPDWGPMADAAGIQLEISENRMFGNVLCHYSEWRLCAIETI